MKREKTRAHTHDASADCSGKEQKNRINQVDILKGLAIVSVILIHTFPDTLLALTGAPYYLWQAVPVFLLLAAFTGTLAYSPEKRQTLSDCYDSSMLARRFRRILLPFTFIWILQVIVILYLLPAQYALHASYVQIFQSGITGILVNFFSGGSGPGNYFIPVILQQIILLPVFYWLAIRLSPNRMLIIAFVTNIALELSTVLLGLPSGIYAISYIPYMMLGAAGVWLAFQTRKIAPWLIIAGIMSAGYITAVYYFHFQFWFVNAAKGFFNGFSSFWTLLLVSAGLRYLSSQSITPWSRVVRELGKASWHIFLIQMTFLLFFEESMIHAISSSITGTGLGYDLVCQALLTIPSLAICLLAGYGFYCAERWIKTRMTQSWPSLLRESR